MAPMSVYVGGLGEDIQKEDLEREFSHFGNLTKVWVARNPPGFAFIDFQNEEDAREAIKEMNGAIIKRSKIRVDKSCSGSKRDNQRSSRVGGFCGGHGGKIGFEKRQNHNFVSNSGFQHRGRDFLQGGPKYQSGGYDGSSVYHSRSLINQSSHVAWKSVGVHHCPELVQAYKDLSKCESSARKRKFSGAENVSSVSVQKRKSYVEKSNDTVMNINCLPEEILIKVFQYLKPSELARIAQVCKWWYKLTSYPVLWKRIKLKFFSRHETQNKVALFLSEKLPTCVTYLILDFHTLTWYKSEEGVSGEFENFCIKLGKRCPSLKALVLRKKKFSICLPSVIDLCMQYMQNLEILSIRYCSFEPYSFKIDVDHCKIKVLDLFSNLFLDFDNYRTVSKMPSLKKLILAGRNVHDCWFENDISFLENLEVLCLKNTRIHSSTFQRLKNRALKLVE